MATRDLTTQYTRQRSAMHRKRGREADIARGGGFIDGAGGGAAPVDTEALTVTAASVIVDLVNDINTDINVLHGKMADLREARLTFDDPTAEEHRGQDILTAEIIRHFNLGAAKLKRLTNFDAQLQDAEIKLRDNIQRGLAARLHDMSTEFRKDQKLYIGNITKYRKGGASLQDQCGGGGKADVDEVLSDEQMHELAMAEKGTDERVREIQRIAKSVEDLSVLFNELATLVVEQGTILDRIDYHMRPTPTQLATSGLLEPAYRSLWDYCVSRRCTTEAAQRNN